MAHNLKDPSATSHTSIQAHAKSIPFLIDLIGWNILGNKSAMSYDPVSAEMHGQRFQKD